MFVQTKVCCCHQIKASIKLVTMAENKKSLKRKLVEAGGWRLARRVGKSVPYVGTAMAIGMVGYDIKKKGLVKGVINSGLDAIPFVGLAKNAVEFFTGDLIPDKPAPKRIKAVNGNGNENVNGGQNGEKE